MSWIALFRLLLSLAGFITRQLERRQTILAAEAEAITQNLRILHERLQIALDARRARRASDADAGGLRADDGYRRD